MGGASFTRRSSRKNFWHVLAQQWKTQAFESVTTVWAGNDLSLQLEEIKMKGYMVQFVFYSKSGSNCRNTNISELFPDFCHFFPIIFEGQRARKTWQELCAQWWPGWKSGVPVRLFAVVGETYLKWTRKETDVYIIYKTRKHNREGKNILSTVSATMSRFPAGRPAVMFLFCPCYNKVYHCKSQCPLSSSRSMFTCA